MMELTMNALPGRFGSADKYYY